MASINNIKVNPCCVSKTLPLAFDESLSYLEMLCGILDKLNETINQVNINTDFVNNYQSEYDELKKEMDDLIIAVDERFESIEQSLNSRFAELTNQVIGLINNNYLILKDYIDDINEDLNYKIDHISIDNIVLRDPTTGLNSNIQIVVNNLFNTFSVDAITATEFDTLELTATAFDAYEITAYEFDTQSKIILV